MDKETYEKYVKLDCWALRRLEYLRKHEHCEGCGKKIDPVTHEKITLQVHHLTYERLGHELDGDLLAVCVECHRAFHKLPRATPPTWILQHASHMPESDKKLLIRKWLPVERSVW